MKKAKHPFGKLILFVLLLTACGGTPTPEIFASSTPSPDVDVPTPSITVQPTAVVSIATLASPALTATSTPDPVYFRDDFSRLIRPGWTWLREDPKQWSVDAAPGSLQIFASRGYVNTETMTNVLLRPVPAGDFQIETKLVFWPENNYQFAGLIIYSSPENFIQAGHGFCRGGFCVSEGLYMNYYKNGLATLPNFAKPYKSSANVAVLRLIRKGNNYIFEASSDGRVFFLIGEHESDMIPLQVGILTGQNEETDEIVPALFDYFEITSPQ